MTPSSSVTALANLSTSDGQIRQEAWNLLAERHGPDVWRLLSSRLRRAHETEDAYQEFWLRLPHAAATFVPAPGDSERRAHAWLLRIAYNAATNRMSRQRPCSALVEDLPAQEDDVMAATEREEHQEMVTRVNRAIEQLPESYRRPVLLHLVGGLSYEDLAADLRCTVNAARVKVHRGVKRLRELLGVADGSLSEPGLTALLVPPLIPSLPPSIVPPSPAACAAAPATGPFAVLTQVPILVTAGAVAATAITVTAAIALSGDPMPIRPTTALLVAGTLTAAVVDDFERDAIAMIANGQGGTVCTAELIPAPVGGTGKSLRLSWPATHGLWVDATYKPQLPPLELTAADPQVATVRVWREAFCRVKHVSIRFMDAKAEWFQWQIALPDQGATGWCTISIPVDWNKPQNSWGGNADKTIDWPLHFQGYAIEFGAKEAPAGAIVIDDMLLTAQMEAAK